jgi:hypothetical protein
MSSGPPITRLPTSQRSKAELSSKQQCIAESLLTSKSSNTGCLRGEVPTSSHKKLGDMAKYLGLETASNVNQWIPSDQFKPMFDNLYHNTILPRLLQNPQLQGSQLKAVQCAIARGEASSDQTYSREVLDKSKFEEVDYYAYCMVRLLRINSGHRNGIFFRRQLNDEEKEARIWMAILRATNDCSKVRWESGRTTTKEF